MSTKNKRQKAKKPTSLIEKAPTKEISPVELFPTAGSNILPGTAPVEQRIRHIKQTTFNGPIPHPEIFKLYGDVIPDAPERILRVFEEDSKHARDIQVAALNAQRADNRRVHWMAYSLIAGGYILSAFFAYFNKDWLAGTILTTTLAGTIAGFFQSRQEERKQSKEKKD